MMTMEDDHHEFFELIQKFRSLNLLATAPTRLHGTLCRGLPAKGTPRFLHRFDDYQEDACAAACRVPYPAESGKWRLFTTGSLPLRPAEYVCIADRCRKGCRAGSRSDAHSLPRGHPEAIHQGGSRTAENAATAALRGCCGAISGNEERSTETRWENSLKTSNHTGNPCW